ncbi:hypothetical protein BDB00DRAFT_68488 [Zychaea mexicana]|uniref:uncharacterized protein n=1 Tax=Zychaea mexicana TaxID=64656 RepID=UPI0022FEBF09|nr:uncharacterized protein BDB00DRAFT_68488 [Zychaea mexicana]KAI9488054.1 hypothetical protein BDB00DRAFT_68488 [Zychaea mexicana]
MLWNYIYTKTSFLTPESSRNCSNVPILFKFRGHLLKKPWRVPKFSVNGDTVPDNFKGKNKQTTRPRKMDLRLMCMATDVDAADLGVGEFAKSAQSTKYLTDRAKMIVCNKAQLITFVKALKLTQEDVKED